MLLVFTEEQIPPDLHVRHRGRRRDGRAQLDGRHPGLAERHNRQVALLNVVTVGARPLLNGFVGLGIRDPRLQRHLRLHSLRGLREHELMLFVQQVEFFEAAVELEHDEHQRDNPDDHRHASHVEREGRHASILIVL